MSATRARDPTRARRSLRPPPQVKHAHFVAELRRRYDCAPSPSIAVPDGPDGRDAAAHGDDRADDSEPASLSTTPQQTLSPQQPLTPVSGAAAAIRRCAAAQASPITSPAKSPTR